MQGAILAWCHKDVPPTGRGNVVPMLVDSTLNPATIRKDEFGGRGLGGAMVLVVVVMVDVVHYRHLGIYAAIVKAKMQEWQISEISNIDRLRIWTLRSLRTHTTSPKLRHAVFKNENHKTQKPQNQNTENPQRLFFERGSSPKRAHQHRPPQRLNPKNLKTPEPSSPETSRV